MKDAKIKFHDEEADDPDWKVRVCYTLLIAAASEVEVGVENLWKSGKSGGRHSYPDFGRYISRDTFRAFQSAAAMCWADPKYWYADKDEVPWEVFMPCVEHFNSCRRALLKAVLLMLDESMRGWRPKTSYCASLEMHL